MCRAYEEMDEKTRMSQKWWAIFFYACAAISYIFSHYWAYRFGTMILTTGTLAPNRFTSTDSKVVDRLAMAASFLANSILVQRIVNLATGKALGELGQVMGRKPLLTFALSGYFVTALLYMIGYLGAFDARYKYPTHYGGCIKKAGCKPNATIKTKPSLVCTNPNMTNMTLAGCTAYARAETDKDAPTGNPAGWAFYLAQGIIGLCAPIGVSVYSFLRDVTITDEEYGTAFGQAVGIGLLFGLFIPFFVGFLVLFSAPTAMMPVCYIGGAISGGIPAILTFIVLKEPIAPKLRKPMLGQPGSNPIDWSPFHAFMYPFQVNTYTAYSFLGVGVVALASAVGESTTFAYVIYAYGFNIVDIGIGLCAAYFLGALNSTLVPKFFGLRRSVYLGLWSYVAVCLIFGFLAGPEHKTFILIIIFFIIPITGTSNTAGQLGLFYAQGDDKQTGAIAGSWKVGEAVFKLLGGLISLIFPAWIKARKKDPTLIPGLHYLVSVPLYAVGCALFVYADCKLGHQNKLQKEQQIVICGIKSRVAEAGDDFSGDVVKADATVDA
jgi:MFS family permease